MTLQPRLLEKALRAGAELAGAENQARTARTEFHALVRRMHLAGGSLREIALALDLSHQRVQQMVDGAGGTWWRRIWRTRNARGMACTFCSRPGAVVNRLIAGPKVFICDDCVGSAERSREAEAPGAGALFAVAGPKTRLRCSFCSGRSSAGGALLTTAGANICGACLEVCRQILNDSAE